MTLPLLIEFLLRLVLGLAIALMFAPSKAIPPAFFRTQCLVMLGLSVVGAWFAPLKEIFIAEVIAAALAYVGSIGWGLGLARIGQGAVVGVALLSGATLLVASGPIRDGEGVIRASAQITSALVLGFTLAAMLLGHHYLTAPAMSIAPLKRLVRCAGAALALRALVALPGGIAYLTGRLPTGLATDDLRMFLAMRWGMGFIAAGLATVLTWKTVLIRSTQSATGILYIAMTLVLFGELTALVLSRQAGVTF